MKRMLVIVLLCSGLGCAGDPVDPRCSALCTIDEPPDGLGLVCSPASADACIDLCERRIVEANSLCAECLLEGATFETPDDRPGIIVCPESPECGGGHQCTLSGGGQTCAYCEGDDAQREECHRVTNPRTEIDCETHFEPVTDCVGFCG